MTKFWRVRDGLFAPIALAANEFARELTGRLSAVNLGGASTYLRGSLLEHIAPHANADLDLIVIWGNDPPTRTVIEALQEHVREFNRALDLSVLSETQIHRHVPQRLLLHTRAFRVNGPEKRFAPVRADVETMKYHFAAYAPWFPPDEMWASTRSRVSALKNLTRCFGVLSFIHGGAFTRDIEACLACADELHRESARALRDAWRHVDAPGTANLEVIKRYILQTGTKLGLLA